MKRPAGNEETSMKEMRRLHDRMPAWIVHLIMAGAVGILAYHTASLLLLLFISGIIAYLLNTIVNRMEYYGISRLVAVSMIYITAAVVLAAADIIFMPCLKQELAALSARLPEIAGQAEEALKSMNGYPFAERASEWVTSALSDPGRILTGHLNATEIFSHAASLAFSLVLVPFFVFFILKDWPVILKTIMKIMPSSYVETTVSILSEVNSISGNYLRGLAIDSFVISILASTGLWMLGVNYPVTLGIITGAANVIPYIGPAASCLIACMIAFFQFKTVGAVLNVVILYTTVKLADDFIVQPLSIGRIVKLHPLLLVAGIIAAHQIFGIIGMIVAVPAVTILQKIMAIYLERRGTSGPEISPDMKSHQIII